MFKGTYNEAQKYCENLSLGGVTGWRVPSLREFLRNAYDMSEDSIKNEDYDSVANHMFNKTALGAYWTSTYDSENSGNGGTSHFTIDMFVWFKLIPGTISGFSGPGVNYVRCVKTVDE